MPDASDLIDELFFPDARGGRKPKRELTLEASRQLTLADAEALRDSTVPNGNGAILRIKHSHHQLASALALGEDQEAVSLMTGYSPAYISVLKADPTFQDLLAYYATQREIKFVDTLERMRSLGLSSLDELQHRLEVDPDGWTKRELMEFAELLLIKPQRVQAAGGTVGGGGNAPGVALTISFLQPAPQPVGPTHATPVLDLSPNAEVD